MVQSVMSYYIWPQIDPPSLRYELRSNKLLVKNVTFANEL
jgi:hypothetical protein